MRSGSKQCIVRSGRRRSTILSIGVVTLLASGSSADSRLVRNNVKHESFSGSLDDLLEKAQILADQDRDTIPSKLTFEDETTLHCTDSFSEFDVIEYTYAMVTEPNVDEGKVRATLEADLNYAIASFFLPECDGLGSRRNRGVRHRKLADDTTTYGPVSEAGVVAVDSRPVDMPSTKGTCNSVASLLTCTVVSGGMTLFFTDPYNANLARYYTLSIIRDFFKTASTSIDGLEDATLVTPNVDTPKDNPQVSSGGGSVSSRSTLIFSCAAVAFVGAAGVALYLKYCSRRTPLPKQDDDVQRVPTAEDSSSDEGPSSPYSPPGNMLPAAYQVTDSMSVILEHQEDDSSMTASDAIVVSEAEWTTEDEQSSVEANSMSPSSNFTLTPVLGARRRTGEPNEMKSAEKEWSKGVSATESFENLLLGKYGDDDSEI